MHLLRPLIAAALAATVFVSNAFAAEVGQSAPAFTLQDIHGESRSLSDFAGKTVVLEWTNYGCPFVKKHYNSGNMQSLQNMAKSKDVVWLSICSSAPGEQGSMSAEKWVETTEEKGVASAHVLLDPTGSVGRSYGAIATPHMYVIDPQGTLVYGGAIDSLPTTKVDDIAKAKNYVVAAIDAVLAGKAVDTPKSKPYGCNIKYAN